MLRNVMVLSIMMTLSWGGAAFAQDGECSCVTPMSGGGIAGQVTSVQGQILASGESGLRPVEEGARLLPGSQLIAGAASSADINYGTCALAVGPNSEVTVVRAGANICVRVNEIDVVTTGQIPGAANVPLFLFGGLAAATAAGAAIGGGNDSASP